MGEKANFCMECGTKLTEDIERERMMCKSCYEKLNANGSTQQGTVPIVNQEIRQEVRTETFAREPGSGLYGAILGDVIGSRFEFKRQEVNRDFELFTNESRFTDDTVMTLAVADALMKAGLSASVQDIKDWVVFAMQQWGREYPNAGYGGSFINWLYVNEPQPYGSYGNGSAMRVSAAGWLYNSLERTREVARATAEVTHNHPEGIKGAECTAAVIFMARTGRSKAEIKQYVESQFGYPIMSYMEVYKNLPKPSVFCQDTVPEALACFFDGDDYEEVVRNAVSLGGDTDTRAAIAGSMEEAYSGISDELRAICEAIIGEEEFASVFKMFQEKRYSDIPVLDGKSTPEDSGDNVETASLNENDTEIERIPKGDITENHTLDGQWEPKKEKKKGFFSRFRKK